MNYFLLKTILRYGQACGWGHSVLQKHFLFGVLDGLRVLIRPVPEISLLVWLAYKCRKIIGKNDFLYHFKKIIVHYNKFGYNIDVCDRRQACLLIQSRLTAMLTSLIARW